MKISTAVNEIANPVGTLARKSPLLGIVWHLYRAAMAIQRLLKRDKYEPLNSCDFRAQRAGIPIR